MLTPTQIAIAVVEHEGCYLVGQRPAGVVLAGYWEFPGGKVKPGESTAEAARRECWEETGLLVEIIDEYPSQRQTYDHGELLLRFFRAVPVDTSVEVTGGFQWVKQHELANLEFPAGNQPLIERLLAAR